MVAEDAKIASDAKVLGTVVILSGSTVSSGAVILGSDDVGSGLIGGGLRHRARQLLRPRRHPGRLAQIGRV